MDDDGDDYDGGNLNNSLPTDMCSVFIIHSISLWDNFIDYIILLQSNRITPSVKFCQAVQWNITNYFFVSDEPGFSGPIANVTAPLGREAILACTVHNLSSYKVCSSIPCTMRLV